MPKCAGGTFTYHIQKNLRSDEYLSLYPDQFVHNPYKYDTSIDIRELAQKKAKSLSKNKRSRIKIIFGHSVPYGIHNYFDKKPYYFTTLRNPTERVISLYNFWCTIIFHRQDFQLLQKPINRKLLEKGIPPDIECWLESFMSQKVTTPSNSMASFLRRYKYLENKIDDNSLNKLVSKFDFIGLIENNNEDLLYMYYKLKFCKFFKNQNISETFFLPDLANKMYIANLKKIINSNYEADLAIYKKARKRNSILRSNKEYHNKIKILKKITNFPQPLSELTARIIYALNSG
ncbi:sulfotransferase family 2 domain-containing protein [Candidatus Woesebacteria bacterium]|nr:sulfotransferase family 2 domain-containing protein [Candidatus Woesebacteria bacterium]